MLSSLPSPKYIILNNQVYSNSGRFIQIDHIVVSVYGIFVIETKNMKGYIYGNANQPYWTQNIWGHKYQLYNPIIQNRKHTNFLIQHFDVIRQTKEYVHPIVVFMRASRIGIYGADSAVLKPFQLLRYIRSFKKEAFTREQCLYIAGILSAENITDRSKRKEQKRFASNARKHTDNRIVNNRCPLCGGALVKRNGRFGSFWGCSNYPSCHYTKN